MSQPVKPGRLDHLAKGVLGKLLKEVGNPELRFAAKMLEEEIDECLESNLGPGTKAHEVGRRVMRALDGER